MTFRGWVTRSLAYGGLLVLAAAFLFASPASAQDVYVDVPPPKVGPTAGAPTVVPQRPVVVRAVGQARVGGLAVTGADVLGLCALAGMAVAVGAVTVRIGRRVPAA